MKFSHNILHTYSFSLGIIKHNWKIRRFWVADPLNVALANPMSPGGKLWSHAHHLWEIDGLGLVLRRLTWFVGTATGNEPRALGQRISLLVLCVWQRISPLVLCVWRRIPLPVLWIWRSGFARRILSFFVFQ